MANGHLYLEIQQVIPFKHVICIVPVLLAVGHQVFIQLKNGGASISRSNTDQLSGFINLKRKNDEIKKKSLADLLLKTIYYVGREGKKKKSSDQAIEKCQFKVRK